MNASSSSDQSDGFAQVLTELAALRQQVAEQQREITCLKTNQVKPQSIMHNPETQITTRSTRRRMLRKLAAGLTIGLVATGAGSIAAKPHEAQARIVTNPSSQIGALIVPGSTTVSGSPASATNAFGLIASCNNSLDLSSISADVGVNGIIGISDSPANGNGVYGRCGATNGSGVYGENTNGGPAVTGRSINTTGYGVWGDSSNMIGYFPNGTPSIIGVLGTSKFGYGMYAQGAIAPIRLAKGASQGMPGTGSHYAGELYVDSTGALFYCYIGDGSNAGTWKQLAP